MAPTVPSFFDALRLLVEHRVDFLVVGGVAANLHGAPVTTWDLYILFSTESDNVDRLLSALEGLEAVYRDPAGRRLAPRRDLLLGGGHHLFDTSAGPLDCLGTIGDQRTFGQVVAASEEMDLDGETVRVLSLEDLIETKQETGRDKDRAVLPILREALKQREA
jgi:hypothetical protein